MADGSSLNYGTLLGSSPASGLSTMTYATAVALDSLGNAYVTGETGNGFFTTPGALNQGGGGNASYDSFNVFLAKFSPAGGLIYSAVLGTADPQNGGGGPIGASAIAVDAAGDAYVAGQAGTVWPITSNAYLKQIAGSAPYATPFVTEVAPAATSLIYSTYLDYAYQVTASLFCRTTTFLLSEILSVQATPQHLMRMSRTPAAKAHFLRNLAPTDPAWFTPPSLAVAAAPLSVVWHSIPMVISGSRDVLQVHSSRSSRLFNPHSRKL